MTRIFAAGNSRRLHEAGFTLVELMVSLLIVSILVASLSLLAFDREPTLQDLARGIAHQLRLAQQRALLQRQAFRVTFDLSENRFQLVDETVELPADVEVTVRTAEDQLLDDSTVAMNFYPDASATGGSILLESGEESFLIEVLWVTGKVIVSANAGGVRKS